MGWPSSFRGILDRESCNSHIFQHSFLRELFQVHLGHYIIASSCTTYSSVIVVCCTCGLNIVLGQSSDGHVEVTNKVGTVNKFLKVVFMWKMLEPYGKVRLQAPKAPEQRKNRQCRYVEQDQYLRMHGPTQFQLVHVRVASKIPYDWTEDLVTEDSVGLENLVLLQCILSEQSFTSLHEFGSTARVTKQY